MNIQTITNVNDCVPLYLPHSLYLKPLAKFYVSVSLPANKLGKTISNYDIMDKLNHVIKPDKVSVLKVSKSTLEFLRFEGELEDRSKLRTVLARLDGQSFKLSSFSESFKVRASEAKDEFPNRHDWDSFFRDARNMDEMKAGERPDTIHLSNLPNQWFCPRHQENEESVKPSENIFKRIFEKFGSVRFVDIPICDPYRSQMKTEISGMKTFRFDQELMFEGYVQFSEYLSFVKAMDEFRGMKLVRKLTDKNESVNIVVTFDKTKHLSDASIKRRNIVRDRLISKERAKHEEELQKKKEEEKKLEKERKHQEELKVKELELQREREEKRKEKHLKKLSEKGQLSLSNKIRIEEKKLLIAQRKLESIRLLEALFERIKGKESIKKELDDKGKNATKLERNDLRNKLAAKYKSAQEELLQKQKTKLEQVKGKTGLLALIERNNRSDRSSSINTISSDDSVLSDSHQTGKSKKKKLKQKKRGNESDTSISSSPSESQKSKLEVKPLNSFTALYNPEMAAELLQQIGMYNPYASPMFPIMPSAPGMQISPSFRGNFSYRGGRGMYNPYASSMLPIMAAAAGMRPGYFHSSYRGNFPYRSGRFGRTRGGGGRISEYYDDDHNRRRSDDHDRRRSDEYDRRRSTSYSRSRSRSRSNRRHRSKSRRSHSRSRRSRSRSHRSRSSRRKRTRSKSQSKSETKLVSTRRSRSSSSSSGWSGSRSKSQSRSWSRNHKHSHSPKVVLQTDKLVRSAREIQRSVQQKLHDRMKADEDKKSRNSEAEKGGDEVEPSTSKQRSISVDSTKFMSPKHKAKSTTPEKEWKD